MEILHIQNLTFTYPEAKAPSLKHLSFTVQKGEFVLLCGASGCGKTTLLRLLKPDTAPHGQVEGEIRVEGTLRDGLSPLRASAGIGLVGQDPDAQVVTDKVWHELAFGLENMGLPSPVIRRRVAEMASFFGIHTWYDKDTDTLSGGQKQLLNLAAVMVMQPDILLLDEPTGQLDPIAASEFMAAVYKLNRELGVTVLVAEHRLEEVFAMADRVLVMEQGECLHVGTPQTVARALRGHPMEAALPTAARLYNQLNNTHDTDSTVPLTIREGRALIETVMQGCPTPCPVSTESEKPSTEVVIEARDLYFRYEKTTPDVLRELNLSVHKGEIYAIVGGNGCGKTSLLRLLSGLSHPYRGSIKVFGKKLSSYKGNSLYKNCLAMLPQHPKALFLKPSLREDLLDYLHILYPDLTADDRTARVEAAAAEFGITGLLDRHPHDVSGGEMQLCALAKLSLAEPSVLLLDEPTKGIDPLAKRRVGEQLKEWQEAGCTVLMVTHDIEFAAAFSDRCALCFDGCLLSEGTPQAFFAGNHFYTTAAARMARGFFPKAVSCEEVVDLCQTCRAEEHS